MSSRGSSANAWEGKVVLVKPVMGRKTVFAQSVTERRALDVLRAFVELAPVPPCLGLEVDVRIRVSEPGASPSPR